MIPRFQERLSTLDWDDTTLRINSKTAHDVEHALASDILTLDDFMALLSLLDALMSRQWHKKHKDSPANVLVMQLGFTFLFIYPISAQTIVLTVVFR